MLSLLSYITVSLVFSLKTEDSEAEHQASCETHLLQHIVTSQAAIDSSLDVIEEQLTGETLLPAHVTLVVTQNSRNSNTSMALVSLEIQAEQ